MLVRQMGFVFFQAEDGIRDIGVTGVQTCALPIWIYDCHSDPTRLRGDGSIHIPLYIHHVKAFWGTVLEVHPRIPRSLIGAGFHHRPERIRSRPVSHHNDADVPAAGQPFRPTALTASLLLIA